MPLSPADPDVPDCSAWLGSCGMRMFHAVPSGLQSACHGDGVHPGGGLMKGSCSWSWRSSTVFSRMVDRRRLFGSSARLGAVCRSTSWSSEIRKRVPPGRLISGAVLFVRSSFPPLRSSGKLPPMSRIAFRAAGSCRTARQNLSRWLSKRPRLLAGVRVAACPGTATLSQTAPSGAFAGLVRLPLNAPFTAPRWAVVIPISVSTFGATVGAAGFCAAAGGAAVGV